jgi:TetR/AcrR family transcriptional regulator, transcriptional repressor for nem operon
MTRPTPVRRTTARTAGPATSTQILDVAERLAQTRGFNGFSYADIAEALGITKASLHYHFGTKEALGCALIERYSRGFAESLARIDASGVDARAKLERYVQLYADVLQEDRICLCGMLAAEFTTLPSAMQQAIRAFFDAAEAWLAGVLDAGRRSSHLRFEGGPTDGARVLTAALEGAMLLARPYADTARFASAAAHVLREFTLPPPEAPGRARPAARPGGRGSAR